MTKELTEIWITKYALSTGVEKAMAEIDKGMASVKHPYYTQHLYANEYSTTESDANKRVLEMIARKRISIQKQLAKLDKLEVKINTQSHA